MACFVSFRAQGTVHGLVGAAGPLGAILYLVTFFNIAWLSNVQGFLWMGIWTCAAAMGALVLRFPMWDSILRRSAPRAVEEDYYGREWTGEEIATGEAASAMRFASETISERGRRSLIALMHDASIVKKNDDYRGDAEAHVAAPPPQSEAPPVADGRYGELMQQRLALLDDAALESGAGWEEFIAHNVPRSSSRRVP